jgi:O-antigen/teichoic acid export membrane protein
LLHGIKAWLPTRGFSGQVALLAGGTVVGQSVVVLASPVLTRLYAPADWGVLATYTAVLSVVGVLSSLRYEQAIPLPDDNDAAGHLLALSLLLVLVTSGALLVILGLWAGPLLRWLHLEPLRPFCAVLLVSVLGGGVYQVLSMWAARTQAFSRLARTRVTQGVGGVAAQLAGGVLHLAPAGLLLGDAVGRIGGSGVLWDDARRAVAWHRLRWRGLWAVMIRYAKFPLITTWAGLLNIISLQLPTLLLVSYFGMTVTGHYALGYRVLGAPSLLIGQAIGQVFFARAAANPRPEVLRALTERTALGLLAAGVPLYGCVILAGPALFALCFGAEWHAAGVYAQALAPWFLLWLISSPLSGLLIVREWQEATLLFTVVECGLRWATIAVGAHLGTPLLAVQLLAGSGVIISLAAIGWFLHAASSSYRRLARGGLLVLGVAAGTLLLAAPLRWWAPWCVLPAWVIGDALVLLALRRYWWEGHDDA